MSSVIAFGGLHMLAQKPDWVGVGSVSSAVRAAGLMNIKARATRASEGLE